VNSFVELKIYDLLGRDVQTLVDDFQQANTYSVNFDASRLSSGIYFYRLTNRNGFCRNKEDATFAVR